MKTFTGELFRRIYSEFAADGELTGCVVEHIGRPFREDAIALRVGVGAEAKKNVAGIVHVDVVIHHDEVFGKHHLPHSPKPVHNLIRLHRIGLLDAYENKVVKDTFSRESGISMSTISGKFILKIGRKSFTEALPM